MTQASRRRHRTEQDVVEDELPEASTTDTTSADEMLDEIDELLEEAAETAEERRRREWKEELARMRTIGVIGRARNPCHDAIRVPKYLAEVLADRGLGEIIDCGDCEGC